MRVRVVPPDPAWDSQFALEARSIRVVLEVDDLDIHHIGSTAIPGIFAKPIIDILVVVDSLATIEAKSSAMCELGYEALGEHGIVGRRYFRKNSANGIRTHQVHSFARGSSDVVRHLAFRDYMRACLEAAQAYSVLKQKLAIEFPEDIQAYVDGKNEFVKHHESLALAHYARAGLRNSLFNASTFGDPFTPQ